VDHSPKSGFQLLLNFILLAAGAAGLNTAAPHGAAQCVGTVDNPVAAARCTSHRAAPSGQAQISAEKAYTLAELIDIAESTNPRTRIAWEQARQAAEGIGIARSEYLPHLSGLAVMANEKLINPFPKPLATKGYTMVEMPSADAGLAISYALLDFGGRRSRLEAAKATQLAAAAHFERENQEAAFAVVEAFYRLMNAQEMLSTRTKILETARAIQAAAEAQLANGRATLPDVLDAKASAIRAEYEREASIGEEQSARVHLRETLGVEPSDQIHILPPQKNLDATELIDSIANLVESAKRDRPDLLDLAERLRASEQRLKEAKSNNWPTVEFNAKGSAQSIWPTVSKDSGSALGDTTQFVWNVGVRIHWEFFDGGRRRSEALARASEQRQASEELRAHEDEVIRATWTAYVQCRTAQRQQLAAEALLTAAKTSYDASLEAYNYGVKNLIELDHAETQLAEARLAEVQARTTLLVSIANLGYTTGSLLRAPAPSNLP
jgi:outer membrane protein TolC